jgi:integrase
MALYRRGRTWWFTFTFQGQRIQRSTRTTNRQSAAKIESKLRVELAEKEVGIKHQRHVTFEDLMVLVRDDWKANRRRSTASSESGIKHLAAYFARKLARHISASDIKGYVRERQRQGAGPASCNREVALLRRAFNLAMESELLDSAPRVKLLKENPARKGFFDEETFTKVLGFLPRHIKPVCEFAYYTGWRKGEVTKLRWDQVFLKDRSIRLWSGETKNNEARFLPLEGEVLRVIRDQRQTVGCAYVFNRGGKPIGDFQDSWNSACRKAGCEGALFHDFRRTAARNLRRAGLSESQAMKITGHKTASIFRRYEIIEEQDVREAIASKGAFQSKADQATTVLATQASNAKR